MRNRKTEFGNIKGHQGVLREFKGDQGSLVPRTLHASLPAWLDLIAGRA